MKKIFFAVTVGLLFNLMPVASAEIAPSQTVQKPDINFCGYALFTKRKQILDTILQLQKHLKENPDDAQAWYELGKLYCGLANYTEALAAFEKAVELEPDNEQFRRARDDAREKVTDGAEDRDNAREQERLRKQLEELERREREARDKAIEKEIERLRKQLEELERREREARQRGEQSSKPKFDGIG